MTYSSFQELPAAERMRLAKTGELKVLPDAPPAPAARPEGALLRSDWNQLSDGEKYTVVKSGRPIVD